MLLCIAARLPRLALEAFSRACSDPGYALVERAGDRSIGIGLASSYQQRHAPWGILMLTPDMEMFDCDVLPQAWLRDTRAHGLPQFTP